MHKRKPLPNLKYLSVEESKRRHDSPTEHVAHQANSKPVPRVPVVLPDLRDRHFLTCVFLQKLIKLHLSSDFISCVCYSFDKIWITFSLRFDETLIKEVIKFWKMNLQLPPDDSWNGRSWRTYSSIGGLFENLRENYCKRRLIWIKSVIITAQISVSTQSKICCAFYVWHRSDAYDRTCERIPFRFLGTPSTSIRSSSPPSLSSGSSWALSSFCASTISKKISCFSNNSW